MAAANDSRWWSFGRASFSGDSSSAGPAAGSWTVAAATAPFSDTTGVAPRRSSTPSRPRMCGRSVSFALGASTRTAQIASCTW
ncbi:hypothetical protein [Streptomyces peucetius]|nr:hypothetical protein CGZ69_27550 [Streptomyces peucetius subsp. caesius ATCC 27952]